MKNFSLPLPTFFLIIYLFPWEPCISQDNIKFDNFKLLSDISNLSSVEGRAGNRNGKIDFGERITMQIALKAVKGDFISTSAFITTNDPYVNIITKKISYEDIAEGSTLYGVENLLLDISSEAPHLHRAEIDLEILDSRKRDTEGNYIPFKDSFTFTINRVGPIQYGGAIIDDDNIGQSQGNGNMIIEKSDGRIEIPLVLRNLGVATVTNAVVRLTTSRNYVTIIEDTHKYPAIESGSDGVTPSDYVFILNESAPQSVPFLPMKLEITGNYGGTTYSWVHEFRLGQFFGELKVNVEPADAEVFVSHRRQGEGNMTLSKIPVDDFVEITMKKQGYQTETLLVPVKENQTTAVNVRMVKEFTPELPLPELNLAKWEDYYRQPVLLPESKKVVSGGMILFGSGLMSLGALGHKGVLNNEKSKNPTASIIFVHTCLTLPGALSIILSFKDDYKKDKPLNDNINKNIAAIGEQRRIASEKAEEANKTRRETYFNTRSAREKRNEEIRLKNEEEQEKRSVTFRIGNGTIVDLTK